MNSKYLTLCVCACEEREMDKIHFDIYNRDKHCEKCGKKFRLIPSPIVGVLVHVKGASFEDREWISIKELKEIMEGGYKKEEDK